MSTGAGFRSRLAEPSPHRNGIRRRGLPCSSAWAVILLLALGGAGGCTTTRSDPMAGRMGPGGGGSIQLRVTNLGFNDATLTAITTGNRTRLGVVPGKANQNFTIPWEALQELRVQISVLAGGDFTTPTVTVNPGERVELLIQENLRSSQLRR